MEADQKKINILYLNEMKQSFKTLMLRQTNEVCIFYTA